MKLPAVEIIESHPTEPSMRASSSTTRTWLIGSSSPPPYARGVPILKTPASIR